MKELSGLGLQRDEAEAVALAEDGEGLLLRIEVVQLEGADFAGPGPRVKEEVQKGIVPEALVAFQVDHLEETENLLLVKEADEGLLGALWGDGEDDLGQVSLLGVEEAEHLGEGLDDGQTLVAGSGQVASLGLKLIQEGQDEPGGDLLQSQGSDLDPVVLGRKGEEELEGIPVGFERMDAHPFDLGKVLIEELMDAGAKFHSLPRCQMAKSYRP